MQLKTMLLNFEKVFDDVEIGVESKTYDGDFLLEMLEKAEVGKYFVYNSAFRLFVCFFRRKTFFT